MATFAGKVEAPRAYLGIPYDVPAPCAVREMNAVMGIVYNASELPPSLPEQVERLWVAAGIQEQMDAAAEEGDDEQAGLSSFEIDDDGSSSIAASAAPVSTSKSSNSSIESRKRQSNSTHASLAPAHHVFIAHITHCGPQGPWDLFSGGV